MTIKTAVSLKSFFEKGDKPSESNFVDLIDSTFSGEIGAALVSAAGAGSTGFLKIDSASAVSFVTEGTAGLALLSANTPASARTVLSAASAGDAIFQIGAVASVRTFIGAASTSAATTASAGLIELATTAEATAGTDATRAMTPATHAAASIFTESFESAEQTVTAAGSLTVPHGLTNAPTFIQCYLICKSAEFNYSVNDELMVTNGINGRNSGQWLSIVPDATNLNIRYGDGAGSTNRPFSTVNKTTGAEVILTNANWNLVIRAFA